MQRLRTLLLNSALFSLTLAPLALAADPAAPAIRLSPDDATLDLDIVATRLDAARSQIQPSLGATVTNFDRAALAAFPQGDQSSLQQTLLQAPGVATDSFGQIHVRNEHDNVQYRLDGVQLPEGLAVFGQALEAHFAHSLSLTTGALPAQYGFRQAGVVDITTKSGTTDPGGQISLYDGSRGTLQPSIEYGGRSGAIDYFVAGEFLQNHIGIENPANSFNADHDATTQFRGFAHVSALLDDATRISLLAGTFEGNYQIPNQPGNQPQLGLSVNGQSAFDSANLNEHQRELTRFGILSLQKHAGDLDIQTSYFTRYSSLYYTPDPLGDLLFTGIAQTAERSDWANGVQSDASWCIDAQHTIRSGFLAQIERTGGATASSVLPVDANGVQTGSQPFTIYDGSARTGARYGVYLQDEWRITPQFTLNYGARFDVVDEYTHDQDASPRVNAVWKATPTTTIHGGYARYFTPPPFELVGATTVTKFLGTSAAATVTQDGIPKAERAHYFDAGVSQVVIPGLTLAVDAYYKIAHNLIDEGQFGSPILLTAFNYAKGQQDGVELSGSYTAGPLSLYGNTAYSRGIGKNIDSAQFNFDPAELAYISQHYVHLDHDQRWTGSGGAAFTLNPDSGTPTRLSADLLVESGLRREGLTPNGDALPGYYTINLAAVQKLAVFTGRATELRLDVINLLDRRYEIRDGTGIGVGAPQYGLRRAILAGVSQRF
jgi:outer membrane receptor protein involved in Fe transport